MKAFEYVAPTSVEMAVERLTEREGSMVLGGGMDLLGLMKDWVAQPERLVSIKDIGGIGAIEAADGGLRIGAGVTVADLAADARVRSAYPALVTAAESVGTPQIRNRGTLGGNLCQRPRCWYFRSELFNCLRKGGSACFAVDGDNRHHAIFDTSPCPIVHPSSCAVALVAYDATVNVVGPPEGAAAGGAVGGSQQLIPISDFFVRPSQNVTRENVLAADEVLTHVQLPSRQGWRSASYVVKHKQSHDWPLAAATAALRMEGGTVAEARIVMGAVAPIPWRSRDAERAIVGRGVDTAAAEAAADAAVAGARPLTHNAYKVRIARTAVKRALLEAAGVDWTQG